MEDPSNSYTCGTMRDWTHLPRCYGWKTVFGKVDKPPQPSSSRPALYPAATPWARRGPPVLEAPALLQRP